MQRFPSLLLATAILAAGGVRAENDTEETQSEKESIPGSVDERSFGPKYAPDDAPAGSATTPAPATPVVATPAPVAATPAPAAKVDDKAAKKDDKFPLHGGVSLSASGDTRWLGHRADNVDVPINGGSDTYTVPGGNGQQQPNLQTSLSLSPSASIPKLADWAPKMSLGGSFSLSVNNWLPAYQNNGAYERQVRMSDLGVTLGFPGLIPEEDFTGIKTNVSLGSSVPLSITSRHQNKITNLNAGVSFGWSTEKITGADSPWGSINLSYAPRVNFNFYSQPSTTVPCISDVTVAGVTQDPLAANDIILAYGRGQEEILANGECVRPGRQNMASIGNSLGASWNLNEHSVSARVGWSIAFLRDLSTNPALSSPNASGQNFNENMNGSLSYSYDFSKLVGFDLGLSAGISSGGPVFVYQTERDGDPNAGYYVPNFPFYDLFYPSSGATSAFLDLSVGL
jgi:hypothetical protein